MIYDLKFDVDRDELMGKMLERHGFYQSYGPYLEKDKGPYDQSRFPELTKMVIIHTSKKLEGPNFILQGDDIISMDIYTSDLRGKNQNAQGIGLIVGAALAVAFFVTLATAFD